LAYKGIGIVNVNNTPPTDRSRANGVTVTCR